MRARAAALAIGAALACGRAAENLPPLAVLEADPSIAGLGATVVFDGRGSRDPDGLVVLHRFIFDDGAAEVVSASPILSHAFASPGTHDVRLIVTDDDGALSAEARISVTVKECFPNQELCDGVCTWTRSDDPHHCGGCFVECSPAQSCFLGMCGNECDEPLLACGGCVDTTIDPDHCGGCDMSCGSDACRDSACTDLPPGTILATYPAPAYPLITGLGFAYYNEIWVAAERRVARVHARTGMVLDEFTIEGGEERRALGLAVRNLSTLFTGTEDASDPLDSADLEKYERSNGTRQVFDATGTGGGLALDGDTLYSIDNATKELIVWSLSQTGELERRPIAGMGPDDTFTDIALDGRGAIWAVRPNQPPHTPPLMWKIAIATGQVLIQLDPLPDPEGFGGVELRGGLLWAMGAGGTFVLVP